ncbi:hypothetical protein FBZ33_2734 [Micromonospora sp. A202]|nr:hypothetical protein FBZ33_2734 [Micromonospora sp. A202]
MAAQEAVGRPLPPDLPAWWLYADGAHSGLRADGGWLIPPGFAPYPIGEALESGHDARLGQGLISLQSPSEMTSTVPSTTLMAVLSSMA